MQLPRYQHRKICNTSQKNKSPSSGSHSSPFPQTTSFASDSYMFHFSLISQDMLEREKEEEKEGERGGREGGGGRGGEEEKEEEEKGREEEEEEEKDQSA